MPVPMKGKPNPNIERRRLLMTCRPAARPPLPTTDGVMALLIAGVTNAVEEDVFKKKTANDAFFRWCFDREEGAVVTFPSQRVLWRYMLDDLIATEYPARSDTRYHYRLALIALCNAEVALLMPSFVPGWNTLHDIIFNSMEQFFPLVAQAHQCDICRVV